MDVRVTMTFGSHPRTGGEVSEVAYASIMEIAPALLRLPDQRALGPDPWSPLSQWWLGPGNVFASGHIATFDASGDAIMTVKCPPIPH